MLKGKTALVLGGGGSKGAYEIGVWQALNELGIDIDIVTGSSIGAVNGALVAQNDFERAKKIWSELKEGTVMELTEKAQFRNILTEHIREEEIRNSATKFGIVTVEFPGFKSHCLFAEDIPQGQMVDYIMASAACFPIIEPHEIGNKKFIDGAYFDNVPVKMALEKGARNVIAVDLESLGLVQREALEKAEFLKLIVSKWDLGSFLVFDPDNTKRIIRLGYLDTMKAFSVFSGEKYTFIKGEFAKRGLAEADAAASVLRLDPTIIYSKEILDKKLKEAIESNKKKGLAAEIKGVIKRILSSKPKDLLREELLAKRYLEKNSTDH